MNTIRLTVMFPEFQAIKNTKSRLILRADHYEEIVRNRTKPRLRPRVGDTVRIVSSTVPPELFVGCSVKDVYTVAIFADEDHPLWIKGEPVSHAEQESFAKKAGYANWAELFTSLSEASAIDFSGYAIELCA